MRFSRYVAKSNTETVWKACFPKRFCVFDFIACLHATEETKFPKCNVWHSGDKGIRTPDPLLARQVLSQLSYTPTDAGLPLF